MLRILCTSSVILIQITEPDVIELGDVSCSVEFLRGKGLFPDKPDEDDDYIPEW